jgi:hypothetical protein
MSKQCAGLRSYCPFAPLCLSTPAGHAGMEPFQESPRRDPAAAGNPGQVVTAAGRQQLPLQCHASVERVPIRVLLPHCSSAAALPSRLLLSRWAADTPAANSAQHIGATCSFANIHCVAARCTACGMLCALRWQTCTPTARELCRVV